MAHEIEEFEDGTVGFFVSRKAAWHVLGEVTLTEVHLAEGMAKSQTGSPVEKRPIFTLKADGTPLAIPGRFATVRTHPKVGETVLGDVGSRYRIIQDLEAFEFGDAIVDDGGAHWESMGSLRGGSTVFASMLLPKEIGHDCGDKVTPRLLLMNTHDGSGCMKAMVTLERTVCANTLRMNMAAAKHTWKIRHTTNALQRLEEARRALGLTFNYLDNFEAEMKAMLDTVYTDVMFEQLTKDLIPEPAITESKETVVHLERERDQLLNLWNAPTQANIAGTQWAAWNAAVEYADWFAPIRAKDHDKARAERQLTGALDGFKQQAYSLIKAAA